MTRRLSHDKYEAAPPARSPIRDTYLAPAQFRTNGLASAQLAVALVRWRKRHYTSLPNGDGFGWAHDPHLIVGPIRSDGYAFFAGCRHFTSLDAAYEHWRKRRYGTGSHLKAETFAILEVLAKIAGLRGWKLKAPAKTKASRARRA